MSNQTAHLEQKLSVLIHGGNHPLTQIFTHNLTTTGLETKASSPQWSSSSHHKHAQSLSREPVRSIIKYDYIVILEPLLQNSKEIVSIISQSRAETGKIVLAQSLGSPLFYPSKLISADNPPQPINQQSWDLHELTTLLQNQALNSNQAINLVHLKHLYGQPNPIINNQIDSLFSSIKHKHIPLLGDQLESMSPLHYEDAAKIIQKILFSSRTGFHQHQISGANQTPLINLGFLLQNALKSQYQIEAQIQNVNFQPTPFYSLDQPNHLVVPTIDIKKGVSDQARLTISQEYSQSTTLPQDKSVVSRSASVQLESSYYQTENTPVTPADRLLKKPDHPRTVKKSDLTTPIKPNWIFKLIKTLSVALLPLLVIIALLIAPLIFTNHLARKLDQINLSQFNADSADNYRQQISALSRVNQAYASIAYSLIPSQLASRIKAIDYYSSKPKKLFILIDLLQARYEITRAISIIFDQEPGEPYTHLASSSNHLSRAYTRMSLDEVGDSQKRSKLLQMINALKLFPQLIPPDESVKVAVMIQNHLELRPTGGFTDAISILTFDQGRLQNSETYSVYQLDSQLMGRVNPPEEITELLGESNWYLRDANWDPNFISTARQVGWFIDKQTNQEIDIVVGLNSLSIKKLLESSNQTYNVEGKPITASNVIEHLYQEPVTPGDSNDLPLIAKIFNQILSELPHQEPEAQIDFLQKLVVSLNQNQTQISTSSVNTTRQLVELGWSGEVINPLCPAALDSQCSADYLMVNEANIGVNRANNHLNRQRTHNIYIQDDLVTHTHTIEYTNSSRSNSWPAGDYKAYLRWYTPSESQFVSLSLDNTKLPSQNITTSQVGENRVYAHNLTVPAGATRTISLVYTVEYQDNITNYAWLFQKQPGIPAEPHTLFITSPKSINSLNKNLNPVASGLSYTGTLDKNYYLVVELKP